MLISCSWLSRHVNLDGVDLDELGRRFTLNVAELEEVHRVGHGLETLVVGHVVEATAIEGTHLTWCKVDVGAAEATMIVCGAPNVAAGQSVPVALPGTTLGELTIGAREVQGHASAGMICSEQELGLSEEHDGIMVLDGQPAPGTPIQDIVPLEDTLFEIDNKSLTHRPDLWGHRGIAREVAAILGRELLPLPLDVAFTDARPLAITVEDAEACPRYAAVALTGVTVASSPLWLKALLHRVGTRAINNVVDATNFVMLDLGNPLHAFDRREVAGEAIVVRRAREGERFTTLDGIERELLPTDLLIGDAERGVALAGIMGGENSEIRDDTADVILESANFDSATIRRTGVRLGLRTESSSRFEKSLDPLLVEDASRAFCRLLTELCPTTRVTSAFMDVMAPLATPPTIELRIQRVEARLGVALGEETIVGYLERLHFGVERLGAGVVRVTVPSFRATKDIAIEADLIEEVGRSFGYDHIEPTPPTITLSKPHPNKQKRLERGARSYLTQAGGLDEVMTYSFDFDPLLERIDAVPPARVRLKNAISAEMPALRTALGPNLLGVLEKNARSTSAVRIFELGRVFTPAATKGDTPVQPVTLSMLASSTELGDDEDARLFFRLKGILAGLARAIARPPLDVVQGGVDPTLRPWAHPSRQALLMADGVPIGYLAEVHPKTLKDLDVTHRATLLELNLDAWRALEPAEAGYSPLPRYPAVFRDFAVVVDEAIRAGEVKAAIASAAPELITQVRFQSEFRGGGLPEGKKSLAWSVTMMQSERTLAEPEVRKVEEAVWQALAERVGGAQRA